MFVSNPFLNEKTKDINPLVFFFKNPVERCNDLMNKKLPIYSLFVHPFDLEELEDPLRLFDDSVPAHLNIGKRNLDVYINFRGHHTRTLPKKSFFVELKSPRKWLGAREFHLNAEYNDPSFIRNKLSLDLFQSFGTLSPNTKFVQLQLNGEEEGIYLMLESVDDLFLKNRGLPSGSIYYAINNDANFSLISPITGAPKEWLTNGYQRKLGTATDDEHLIEFIYKINKTPVKEFQLEISKYLSVEKYLRWLAVAICTQNLDGFLQNYALYRNTETSLFEIIPWDYDATFGRDWDGDILEYDAVPIKGYNTLTEKLLEIPDFKKHYRLLLEELLDTLFTPSFLEPKISEFIESILPHLSDEQSNQLDDEKELMIQFIKDRNQYLRNQLTTLI
jgi:spore coat protein H